MKIEFNTNKLDNDWWFSLGISYQKTEFHSEFNKVCTVDLGFWTMYIRWDIKKKRKQEIQIMRNRIYTYTGTVERVVDGDTYDIVCDLGFAVYHKIRIRLRGVDTPEVYGKNASEEGRNVSEYVKGLIEGKTVSITTYKNAPSSFNRWEADVYFYMLDENKNNLPINLAEHLVVNGKAIQVPF